MKHTVSLDDLIDKREVHLDGICVRFFEAEHQYYDEDTGMVGKDCSGVIEIEC